MKNLPNTLSKNSLKKPSSNEHLKTPIGSAKVRSPFKRASMAFNNSEDSEFQVKPNLLKD